MTVYHHISITRRSPAGPVAAGVVPTSKPPGYQLSFGGASNRMHKLGHIWFNTDQGQVTIQLVIDTKGYVFANNGTSDGSQALFISDDTSTKTKFDGFGVFSAPTLDATFRKLTFSSTNTGGALFFYQLNVIDPNGVRVTWDPIIVNQP